MINEIKRKQTYLPLNIQLFAEGDPEPTDPPADPEPTPEPKIVTMTQDELDALISKSKAQAKKPFGDYDELKTKLSDFEKAEAERKLAEMSEQERRDAELATVRKALEDEQNARKQTLDVANQRAIKSDFKLAAANANIRGDALDDAFLLVNKTGISVDDDGNVVGLDDAVKALIEAKPYLLNVTTTQKPKVIGEPNNPKEEERKTLQAQLDDAKKRKDFSKTIELANKLANFN